MDKNLLSAHRLLSDYSAKGKLKTLITGWAIFIGILIVTKIPSVQNVMIEFSNSVTVDWVTSSVKFLISGLGYVAVPMLIGTLMTVFKKQNFDEIRLYGTGIGFLNSKSQEEHYAAYSDVKFSYGKMRDSFWVESKAASIKSTEYGWREFAQPDILRGSIEKYGRWN
ncbi:MAG: hypothetical protein LBT44_08865 [Clostridiales bacterium]|jgi:hypothetical protein|nr:hypothetical protein [Clostridiales bacterium]